MNPHSETAPHQNLFNIVIIALLDYFRSEVRLTSTRLPKNPNSFFLETSMSTNRSKDRSSLCSFSFPMAVSAALPAAPASPDLCAAGQDFGAFLSAPFGVLSASALASDAAIRPSEVIP